MGLAISCGQSKTGFGRGVWLGRRAMPIKARRLLAAHRSVIAARAQMLRGSAVWTVQIVRDWVVGFNARGPDGLINGRAGIAILIMGSRQMAHVQQPGRSRKHYHPASAAEIFGTASRQTKYR